MHGQNPIRRPDYQLDGKLHVQKLFRTIQGEGPFAGVPAIFIRLAGCNLACTFCDTEFESGMEQPRRDPSDLAEAAFAEASEQVPLVVLTGGEPFRQNILPLIRLLCARFGFHVQIETAGTLWFAGWQDMVDEALLVTPERWWRNPPGTPTPGKMSIVVSPKTSKVNGHFRDTAIAWKYIVRHGLLDPDDGLPIGNTQSTRQSLKRVLPLARPPAHFPRHHIYLQPCDEQDATTSYETPTARNTRAAIDSCIKHGYRFCLQVHKMIGLE